MDVILRATDTHRDVAEFTDYTTYVCVNFRKVNCRQESVAIFHRKDYVEVYFCIGVCQFEFSVVAAMRADGLMKRVKSRFLTPDSLMIVFTMGD